MQRSSNSNRPKPYHKRKEPKKTKKILGLLWYFLMGSETIYHIFKGLYLTAIFTVYEPFMKTWNTPADERGVVGATIFSLDEWSYHFLYGLKGPSVLFGAYLLYRYTCYLSPFKPKKSPRKPNDRPIRTRSTAQQTR